MEEDFDDATMDACLIASGQRAEHYEMAAYGTLVAWARAMGHTDAANLLQETLDEEKAADEKLSALAEGGINQGAANAGSSEEDEEEPAAVGPARGTEHSGVEGQVGLTALAPRPALSPPWCSIQAARCRPILPKRPAEHDATDALADTVGRRLRTTALAGRRR